MKKNNIKLSICIPTYDRITQVIEQIKFLSNEISENSNIEFIIGDNCSEEKNLNRLKEFLSNKSYIKLNINEKNLGLVGNLKKLFELSSGEYIWFVGDDDILEKGIVEKIIKNLKDNDMVFINHNAFKDKLENVVMKNAIPENLLNNNNIIESIFSYSGTTLMFITACIYKKEKLAYIIKQLDGMLSDPLFYSIYCGANNRIGIIKEIMIHNKWGKTSWEAEAKRIFCEEIPTNLLKLNINSDYKKRLLKIYIQKRKKAILKYNLLNLKVKNILSFLRYYW